MAGVAAADDDSALILALGWLRPREFGRVGELAFER